MLQLRPYQIRAIEGLRDGFRKRHRWQVLSLPTGAGKTVIAAAMMDAVRAKGKHVIFIADRIALVQQTSQRLSEAGIRHGMMQGSNHGGWYEPIQVCSAQTLERRGWPTSDRDKIGLVVIDECHTQREKIIRMCHALGKHVIGLTATPLSKGMGNYYSNIVTGVTTSELIADHWLVPVEAWAVDRIDMTGAKVVAGEWTSKECETRAIPVCGDIVSDWQRITKKVYGGPVKTIVSAATVAHAHELCKEWQQLGFRFETVTYEDGAGSKKRRSSIEQFRAGRIDGLVSCEALSKGFDVPDALCLVVARPYRKSLQSHIQLLGRIMRISDGKHYGLVIDHVGNYRRHYRDTMEFWDNGVDALDSDPIGSIRKRAEKRKGEPSPCECGFIAPPGAVFCPKCGKERPKKRSSVSVVPGKATRIRNGSLSAGLLGIGDLWPHVCGVVAEETKGDVRHDLKKARAKYHELTGEWPDGWRRLEPLESPMVHDEVRLELAKLKERWIRKKIRESRKAKKNAATITR